MEGLGLVPDLVLAAAAAFVGGVVAQRLGQPVILGYLVAGFVIGPFSPGPTADPHSIQVLAEIGVAFLMFALGAELSLDDLRSLGRVATVGGGVQVLGTMALGPLVAPVLGLSFAHGVFLGALLALSSTVVALKLLMGRGELQALQGRVALGILIAQDLAVVPMIVVLPALGGGGQDLAISLGGAALKMLLVLAAAYVVGLRAVPLVLEHAAIARTRELFLLGVVALALGTALLTYALGLSLAFGAFLAGAVVAQSDFRTQVIGEALPFRDLFAALFFVSVGMLIDPAVLLADLGPVVLLAVVAIVGKGLVATVAVLLLGMPGRVALLAGLSLAQVGEFSFVLARIGVDAGAIPSSVFEMTLATSLATVVLAPFLLDAGPRAVEFLQHLPAIGRLFADPVGADTAAVTLRRHVVVCGYGRVARELVHALDARGVPYVVVEYNPALVRRLRDRGARVVYGDAGNPAVLEHASVATASVLAVLMPDVSAAELATHRARSVNPRLHIVARARDESSLDRLRRAGASAVVQPEFEAGVEVISHVLHRYGASGPELVRIATARRRAFYGTEDEESRG